jgi:hypothetical protein
MATPASPSSTLSDLRYELGMIAHVRSLPPHPASSRRSSDPRSAAGPRPAVPSEPGCSLTCPHTGCRRRRLPARYGATASQDQEPIPGHRPGGQPPRPPQSGQRQYRHYIAVAALACFRQLPQLLERKRLAFPARAATGRLAHYHRHVVLHAAIGYRERQNRPQRSQGTGRGRGRSCRNVSECNSAKPPHHSRESGA